MKSLKYTAIAALLSIGSVDAAGKAEYSYLSNGADWPFMKDTQCMETNQSPIDLRTREHSQPFQESKGTEFRGTYFNIEKATVKNLGKTIQVDFSEDDQDDNYFRSGYAEETLGAKKQFNAAQFHFHAQSEHTIMGKRYDFEMHTVHLPEEAQGKDGGTKIIASAVGLMFDTEDFDQSVSAKDRATIDAFFDSLGFGEIPPVGEAKDHVLKKDVSIPYGDLMRIANFANRWVYTGSLTTPPCSVGVYFQVVDRVLPISKKHYNNYLRQQRENLQTVYYDAAGTANKISGEPVKMDVTGNWRITNEIDKHNVTYMRIDIEGADVGRQAIITAAVAIIVGVVVVISIILAIVSRNWAKKVKELEMSSMEGGHTEKPITERKGLNRLSQVSASHEV